MLIPILYCVNYFYWSLVSYGKSIIIFKHGAVSMFSICNIHVKTAYPTHRDSWYFSWVWSYYYWNHWSCWSNLLSQCLWFN